MDTYKLTRLELRAMLSLYTARAEDLTMHEFLDWYLEYYEIPKADEAS